MAPQQNPREQFTKYETARILGARALQIAMDAPILLKISEPELEQLRYDAIKIAEREFNENVLPISIYRPIPRKGKDKLGAIKEDKVSDEELIQKEKEMEREIIENPREYSLVDEEAQDSEEGDSDDT